MKKDNLLVVDVETGGLDANKHSITSLAFVLWNSEKSILKHKQWHILEDPISVSASLIKARGIDVKTCVDFDALKKHGISPKQVCSEIRQFLSFFEESRIKLAGHNPGFDFNFLKRLFRLGDPEGRFPFSSRLVDTYSIAKFLQLKGYEMPENINSDTLFSFFDVEPPENERHTALGDAVATAKLLTKLYNCFE